MDQYIVNVVEQVDEVTVNIQEQTLPSTISIIESTQFATLTITELPPSEVSINVVEIKPEVEIKIASSVDLFYEHNQLVPLAVWVIEHKLGKYPSVTVVDSAGTVVFGDIFYDSEDQVTITFGNGFSGKAYLN